MLDFVKDVGIGSDSISVRTPIVARAIERNRERERERDRGREKIGRASCRERV